MKNFHFIADLIEIDGSPNLFQLYSIEVYLKIFSNTEKNKSLYQSIFRSSGKNGLTRTEFDNYLNLLKLFKLHQTEFYFNICTILSESLFKVSLPIPIRVSLIELTILILGV